VRDREGGRLAAAPARPLQLVRLTNPPPPPHPTPHPQAALKSARVIVDRLLEREKDNNGGKWPETIALVLWGTDNIKTYGESLAQVRGAPGGTRRRRGRGASQPQQQLRSRACGHACPALTPPHPHPAPHPPR
jgi:hypothetical protein